MSGRSYDDYFRDLYEAAGYALAFVEGVAYQDFIENIDELAIEIDEGTLSGLRRLLETYNQRVDAVESDKSLLIEIPHNLQSGSQ